MEAPELAPALLHFREPKAAPLSLFSMLSKNKQA